MDSFLQNVYTPFINLQNTIGSLQKTHKTNIQILVDTERPFVKFVGRGKSQIAYSIGKNGVSRQYLTVFISCSSLRRLRMRHC